MRDPQHGPREKNICMEASAQTFTLHSLLQSGLKVIGCVYVCVCILRRISLTAGPILCFFAVKRLIGPRKMYNNLGGGYLSNPEGKSHQENEKWKFELPHHLP